MPKVLVIDDDLVMLNAINHILSKNGYEVDTATNGKEGLEKIDVEEFDLVITDIMMPHHNGLAVLSMVKNNPVKKQTKVVAMSSAGNIEIKNEAIVLGAEEFMTKPIRANYLLEVVRKYTSIMPEHRYLVTRKPSALRVQN